MLLAATGLFFLLLIRRKGSLLCLIKVTKTDSKELTEGNQGWRRFVVPATLRCAAHGLGRRPAKPHTRAWPCWVCAIRGFLQRTFRCLHFQTRTGRLSLDRILVWKRDFRLPCISSDGCLLPIRLNDSIAIGYEVTLGRKRP